MSQTCVKETAAPNQVNVGEEDACLARLRVCMISYSAYESDGRVMRYAELLAKLGSEVDVIAVARNDRPPREVIAGVNVLRVQRRLTAEKGQLSYLFRVLQFFFRAMWVTSRRDWTKHYDLVHIHSVPDFLVFVALLPKLRGAKVILDIHDILPELYASKFEKWGAATSPLFRAMLMIERVSSRFADYVIAANDIWREKLVARSVPAAKCTSLLNFPNRSVFKRRGRTRQDDRFLIIYPGTLNWHQGLDLAIRAFNRIKDAHPKAEFHIYGIGPSLRDLSRLIEELDLADRVKLLGTRKLSEIAEVMENADLGIVPKRNNPFGDEAFSTKTLEFMAMGVPVIVSNTKIDRYYFNDALVKFFEAGNESSLAAAMAEIIESTSLREALVRNATEFVRLNDWETHRHKYIGIVRQLLRKQKLRTTGQLPVEPAVQLPAASGAAFPQANSESRVPH
jgi:glycosyltransferase involved in cell wall biosynthesis